MDWSRDVGRDDGGCDGWSGAAIAAAADFEVACSADITVDRKSNVCLFVSMAFLQHEMAYLL